MLSEVVAKLKEIEESTEAGAAGSAPPGTRSAKGISPSVTTRSAIGVRSEGGSVQRQDEVLKLLEDLHAWPKQVVEEVAEVSQLMGALSLSAHERAGDLPLVVVRVLQVLYCLFKSMCCICP